MSLPSYPFDVDSPLDPPPQLAVLRDTEPVSLVEFAGAPAWLLTRHDDIRAALNEPRLLPYLPGMVEGTEDDAAEAERASFLLLMSGQPHARLRALVSGALSARRIAALQPVAERVAADRLSVVGQSASEAELIRDVTAPLTIETLSELIRVDVAARDDFASWSVDVASLFGAPTPEIAQASGAALFGFIARLVETERDGDGLIGHLFQATDEAGTRLTDGEVNGLIGQLLLNGYLPTAQVLALAALRLLTHPTAATTVRADPTLLPGTVEELLRLDPGAAGNVDRAFRARTDLELAGHTIRRGQVVVTPLGAANRDPERFPAPDQLDPTRRPNPHLSFAPGLHHCLGAALARLQLQAGLAALLHAPGPVELGEPDWRTGLLGETLLAALPLHLNRAGHR